MKRFLSVLLTLALLLGTLPAAFAQGADDPITFSIFVDHTWYWMDCFEDEVAQEVTRRTGVKLDVTRATDSNQLAVMISSGDMPDLVYTSNTTIMNELRTPEVCWSYNELVEKTGADLNADASEILINTAPDGNYYALLNTYVPQSAYDNNEVLLSAGMVTLSYRKDIYEELGSPAINTLEDLEALLIKVKEAHPDMIPLIPVYEYESLNYFKQALGIFDQNVGYNADGKVAYKLSADHIRDYYMLLNRYSREGLLSPEAMTYSYSQVMEVAYAGKVFAFIRATGDTGVAQKNANETGSGYTWDMLVNDVSDNTLRTSITAGWSGLFITKNCKDPERAIKFMEFCRSDEGRQLMSWGIPNVHWEYDENGQTRRTQYYRDQIAAGKGHQADLGVGGWIFGDKGDENSFIDHGVTDELSIKGAERRSKYASTMKVWSELGLCLPTDGDELTILKKLNDMVQSEEMKVIFASSEEEASAAFDTMIERANSIGLQQLNDYLNARLAEVKAQ